MLLTMITGMGRTRIKGTSPLTVMDWLSPYLIQPRTMASSNRRSHMTVVEQKPGPYRSGRGRGSASRNPAEQRCYVCQSLGHLSYNCPNRASGGNAKSGNQTTSGRAQVSCCTTVQRIPKRVECMAMNDCAVPIGESVCV